MGLRWLPLSLRIVIVAIVPAIALVVLGIFQIGARVVEAEAAQQELVRTEAIEQLALVQSANLIPEIYESSNRALAGGGNAFGGLVEQAMVGNGVSRYIELDDVRVAGRTELETITGPELMELFDRQRESIEALIAEGIDGDLPPELVEEARAIRAEVDTDLADFFQTSSSDAWVVYNATIDAIRQSWTEYVYYVPTLRGDRVLGLSELNRLTGRRELATQRVTVILPADMRDDVDAVFATPSYLEWVEAVDTVPEVVSGAQPPMSELALVRLTAEALDLADSIELLAAEAIFRVRQDLIADAEQARAEERELQVGVFLLFSITVLLVLLILRSLLGPLASLTRRARSLAEGRLDEHISEITGRDELTRLASTIEDVASGLRHLDRQVRAITAGDLDNPSLTQAAPGPIGAYVQEQVEALRDASGALQAEASTDALTGLRNRRGLVETLQSQDAGRRESDPERRRAIVFVDLDKFKAINDNHGHKHGDAVLIAVARRLEELVRSNDLVARLGGDEFVLVSDGLDPQTVHLFLERVEQHLAQPVSFEGVVHQVGCSVGMAWLDYQDDLDQAIDVADRRMLAVKTERGTARR